MTDRTNNFEPWVIPALAILLTANAVFRCIVGLQHIRSGVSGSPSVSRLIVRRIGDCAGQFAFLSTAYVSAVLPWRFGKPTTITICLLAILVICRHLMSHVFGKRGFLRRDPRWGAQFIAGAYYLHFMRNYFYITWLFACGATGIHTNCSPESPSYSIANPSGSVFIDFGYYTVVTMSTLGYGDISPIDKSAKAMAMAAVAVGLFVLVTYSGAIVSSYISRISAEEQVGGE